MIPALDAKDPLEYFPTPAEVTRAILPHLGLATLPMGSSILDPCAGEGHLLDATREWCEERLILPVPHLGGMEIHPTRHRITKEKGFAMLHPHGNSLRMSNWFWPDVILMKPPFGYAMEFWKKALQLVKPRGTVAMLVRTSFLQTKERAVVLRSNMPDVGLFTWRPSFYGDGTDRYDYAWLVHHPNQEARTFFLWKEPRDFDMIPKESP